MGDNVYFAAKEGDPGDDPTATTASDAGPVESAQATITFRTGKTALYRLGPDIPFQPGHAFLKEEMRAGPCLCVGDLLVLEIKVYRRLARRLVRL